MTRRKKAEEDRMEWVNGGKEKKRAVCCILVTHQGLETKTYPQLLPLPPPSFQTFPSHRKRGSPNGCAHALICFHIFSSGHVQRLRIYNPSYATRSIVRLIIPSRKHRHHLQPDLYNSVYCVTAWRPGQNLLVELSPGVLTTATGPFQDFPTATLQLHINT